MARLAHENVYTRLGPSRIHGVGVFAIANIPIGTNVFANDHGAIVWTPIALVEDSGLSDELVKLYLDFGMVRDGFIGVPTNFNSLTPGWYVNQPKHGEDPNVAMNGDFHFFALRDIAQGEEITAVYAEYSQPPHLRAH